MPPAEWANAGMTVGGSAYGDAGWALDVAPRGVGLYFGLMHEGILGGNAVHFCSRLSLFSALTKFSDYHVGDYDSTAQSGRSICIGWPAGWSFPGVSEIYGSGLYYDIKHLGVVESGSNYTGSRLSLFSALTKNLWYVIIQYSYGVNR